MKINNLISLKNKINRIQNKNNILGTILIADEGINGTISGTKSNLDYFIISIKRLLKIKKISLKISKNNFVPFYRLKIRLKKEIVTIGDSSIKPLNKTGKHVHPKNWDKIINDKNNLIIDTRNEYEIGIGSFKNAVNPKIVTFREFPKFILNSKIEKNKPIAMFCTGGIRCEKASAYLLKNGFKNVSQLDGGILNYLEYKKNKNSTTWKGECFVFDNRVAVNNKLKMGSYDQCYGCRVPLSKKDMKSNKYIKGVSCPYCYKKRTKDQKQRSQIRQNQIDNAEEMKKSHPFKKLLISDLLPEKT